MSPRKNFAFREEGGLSIEDLEKNRQELSPETKLILSDIEFDLLKSLFEKITDRSGLKGENINFLSIDSIDGVPESLRKEMGPAQYDIFKNIIFLNGADISNENVRLMYSRLRSIFGEDTPLDFEDLESQEDFEDLERLFVLHAIIHEEVHAISNNVLSVSTKDGGPPEGVVTSGYSFSVLKIKDSRTRDNSGQSFMVEKSKIFEDFDEAINEALARKLFLDYLQEDTNFIKNKKIIKHFIKYHQSQLYNDQVAKLDTMIKDISEQENMNRNSVWNALVRSKLEGIGKDQKLDAADFIKKYLHHFER
ncbi:MAG: hypothetical protein COX80_02860 [Candidatus Magasanikbacteria bacterium CG_4_10_14_0_2_um_filter_33_14]|uniref:Uncharacterized protein n=1 Tax=Candidatus Magasanikbacteria bacterium CG_4_10_14_0_2_um_filter_33_14 TaxID=1974636 RepID=A0A2M7VAZ6_9BACT|nr:MAG: hypothetical protein COX80_02860 [Candidatus Magasanikbacteria bacterium CG_4_10_14_0_2_um_filter_33_14]